ncbi:MAG TPA: hypothetical protein VHD91_02675 [Gaiellaceae bacterium]|nr:hypothetical protein [Gaiellaceae bacterium]
MFLGVISDTTIGHVLAAAAAALWALSAGIVPRRGRSYLVATEVGLETHHFGRLTWDEIAAVRIHRTRKGRALDVWDRDRIDSIRRAHPPALKAWLWSTRWLHLPLLRISERMTPFDPDAVLAGIEELSGRNFREG